MDVDVYTENVDNSNTSENILTEFEDSEVIVNLGTLAAKIAYYNFRWRFVTLLIFNTMAHIGVESFLTTYDKSAYLKFGKWLPKHRIHVPQFVVFGQDSSELSEMVQWLVQSKYDNTARFIVVCVNPIKCDEQEIFQTLTRFYVVNVIFAKATENSTEPSLFSYYPILPGKCRNTKPYRIKLSNCTEDVCYKNMYPEKFMNLHKCPFVVSTLEQPPFMYLRNGVNGTLEVSGADGDLLNAISDILNATLYVRTPDDGEWGSFENNNWTGSFGDIFNKRAHVSLCAAPLTPQLHGNFVISQPYATLDMVWAARLPTQKPEFEKLINPLKIMTRIALLLVFAIIIMTNGFLKTKLWHNFRRVLNIGPTNASLFFYSWLVFFGMPLMRLPSNGALRFIVASWIWFCFVIRTAYQAALVGSMKSKLYEDYLDNFEDVIRHKYPYGGIGTLRDYYSEDEMVIANWVYVKFNKAYGVLDSLLNGSSDFVIALNKEYIIEHLMKFNGTLHVQIIPEKIVNSPAVLYYKKFNPLRAPIDRILSILIAGGIIDGIYSDHLDRGNYFFHHEEATYAEPLTMHQISSSLAILFIGWSFSIIYFFVEVLAKRFEKGNGRDSLHTVVNLSEHD